jgi:hypothetical protein
MLAALVFACSAPIAAGEGRVTGMVGAWPAAPLGGDVAPAPNKVVRFVPAVGGQTHSVTSGADGKYSIDLAPGSYEVRLDGYQPAGLLFGRNPNTYGQWPQVTVGVGNVVNLDLIYDSGIR